MTSAYSSRILSVFVTPSAWPEAGTRRSRSSELLPVQSIRMSPGSSIAIASSAETTVSARSTVFDLRPSIRSLTSRSIELSGQNPSAHPRRSAIRSEGMDCLKARPSASSDGSKRASTLSASMASVRYVSTESATRYGRELDHPGAGVVVSLLI